MTRPDPDPALIECSGRRELAGVWLIALFLTGFVWMLWAVFDDIHTPAGLDRDGLEMAVTAAAGLFSLLAAAVALNATRDWRRLGPARLRMHPYPAGVGGELGGLIKLASRLHTDDRVTVALQCIRRRRASGQNSSNWSETVLWEREGSPVVEAAGRGARLTLRFALPPDQPPSDDSGHRERIEWRLYLETLIDGHRQQRHFTLPVGPTPNDSGRLNGYPMTEETPPQTIIPASWMREQREAGVVHFIFPAFRHLRARLLMAAFGLLFFGGIGGVLLWLYLNGHPQAAPLFFPVVFLLFCLLMLLPLLWLPVSSRVSASADGLMLQQSWFGVPWRRRWLPREALRHFSQRGGMQMRVGNQRQQVHYRLIAHDHDQRRIPCGGHLPGHWAVTLYESRLRAALGMDESSG